MGKKDKEEEDKYLEKRRGRRKETNMCISVCNPPYLTAENETMGTTPSRMPVSEALRTNMKAREPVI